MNSASRLREDSDYCEEYESEEGERDEDESEEKEGAQLGNMPQSHWEKRYQILRASLVLILRLTIWNKLDIIVWGGDLIFRIYINPPVFCPL